MEIMDKRGTGFLSIREDIERWELPPPEFEEKQGWFVIRFRNPNVERVIDVAKFELNEQQGKAVEYLQIHGRITNREYRKLFNIVKDTAHRDIMNLIDNRLITKNGVGPGTYYTLKSDDKSNDN